MKKGLCEIVCIVDRSGSMSAMTKEAIGAFNAFLEDQQKHPGEALMTITIFDHEYDIIHSGKPIKEIPKFTELSYLPRGMTALHDAVGRTIDDVGKRLDRTPEAERPERVLVMIMTDGQENASKDYRRCDVIDRIRHQREKYGWEFVFLAAGENAFTEAQDIGIFVNNIVKYAATADAHQQTVGGVSCSVASYRSGQTPNWQNS